MRPLRRLIVNADDFGLTRGVSEGILAAHREGIVTSTTVMVNWPWAPDLVPLLRQAPGLGVGLHLTLTAGPPVLPPRQVPSLVGPDGRFARDLRRLLGGALDPAEVRQEWLAQVQRFVDLCGRLPTHLDTHHFVHVAPALAGALADVARAAGVPAARVLWPRDLWRPPAPPREWPQRALLAALALRGAPRLARSGLRLPRGAVLGNWDAPSLAAAIRRLPPGTWEVVCHPGRAGADLARVSSLCREREVELAALCHPAVRAAVQAGGWELIHFGQL